MHIPTTWTKASGIAQAPNGKLFNITVWGWGDDQAGAGALAAERLQRVLDRIGRGEPFPAKYAYGSRPLREEILETFDGAAGGEPAALLTRNSYGAQVLNAARLLFLDIDLEEPTTTQRIKGLFAGKSPQETALTGLRDALQQHTRTTFRVYRTAAGLRVMAVDREFDPAGPDARQLMEATGTDPAFMHLCRVQHSFRARLTPKPWRCELTGPPGDHPRQDAGSRQRFAEWLSAYEAASQGYAVCRYLETIGPGEARGEARTLLELHDRVSRAEEDLPLA
jgi:hypothetical protein